MTPHVLHPGHSAWQAVEPVLRENGCAVDHGKAAAEGLQLVRKGAPCANTESPNAVGVVQARVLTVSAGRAAATVVRAGRPGVLPLHLPAMTGLMPQPLCSTSIAYDHAQQTMSTTQHA